MTAENQELTIIPTSTPIPYPYLFERCTNLAIIDQPENPDGFVLLSMMDNSVLITSTDHSFMKRINNVDLGAAVISPDYTQLAYIQESPRKLVIISTSGFVHRTFSIPDNWVGPFMWVSEDRIFIEKRKYFHESKYEPGILISFEPDSGRYEELLPDYPEIVP